MAAQLSTEDVLTKFVGQAGPRVDESITEYITRVGQFHVWLESVRVEAAKEALKDAMVRLDARGAEFNAKSNEGPFIAGTANGLREAANLVQQLVHLPTV